MTTIFGGINPTGVTGYSTTTETSTNYGLWFTVAKAGTLTGIWFYSPATATTLPTGTALFTQTAQGTGTLIASNASPTWSGAAGSGWVQDTSFPSTALVAGTVYDATYFAGAGGLLQGFIFTGSTPAALFPTTSSDGNITAPVAEFGFNNAPFQAGGTYQTLPSSNNANSLNWLADVTVQFAVAGAVGAQPGLTWRRRFQHRQQLTPVASPLSVAVAVPAPGQLAVFPRRKLARAVWRGGQGQAYVFVPAPRQQPGPAPRRVPARAVWRGSAPFTGYVAVPAPRQQPRPAPHRAPARAYVQFTPVTTVNAAAAAISGQTQPTPTLTPPRRRPARAYVQFTPVTTVNIVPVPGTIPALMASQTRTAVRRDGRVVRR